MEPLIPFINGPKQRDFFILATQCSKDNQHWDRSSTKEGKGDAPMTITMEILDDVICHYPVDERAISVFGFSSGGYGVWSMGREYPGRFAALIPVSCNPHRNVYKFVVNYGTVVWTFNNIGDNSIVYSRVKEEIEQIHNKGGTAYMTTFETKGHEAWRNALLETPFIDWLMWLQRDPSPYHVPYWITPPERSKNDFFMLFIFPFYLCGLLLFVPIAILTFEKIIEMETRSKKINDYEDDIDDTEN
jgi:predicted esterase